MIAEQEMRRTEGKVLASLDQESPLEVAKRLDALRQTVLRDLGNNLLLRLLHMAQEERYEAGAVLCEQGAPMPGFWLLLQGDVELMVQRPGAPEEEVTVLRPYDVFGLRTVLSGRDAPVGFRVSRLSPATALFFRKADLDQLVRGSGAARQALWDDLPPHTRQTLDKPELLQLVSALPGLPLDALTWGLAKAIVNDFPNDRVLVVRLDTPTPPSAPTRRPEGVWYVESPDAGRYHEFDYVFVLGAPPPGMELDTAVQLTQGVPAPPVGPKAASRLLTVLISPSMPVRHHGLTGASDGRNRHLAPHGGVWIDLDVNELAERLAAGEEFPALPEGMRENLSRWARAVTHRRVGIALSGGGAWGFYHSVILRELRKAHVPIDVVTSASMGSVIGAYYSALGLEGLDLVYERSQSWEMTLYALASIVTTASIQALVESDLGELYLEQLATRFHPVTTDITTGNGVVTLEGSLGLAVRASSSAPGIWAPTLLSPRHRYVDGCVSNEVPVSWLAYLGADLTFASNCYPSTFRKYWQVLPGPLGRFLAANDPLGRVADLSCSGSIMLHRSGYLGGSLANVFFDVQAAQHALIDAMNFGSVDKIIHQAETDPMLHEAVKTFALQWEELRLRGRGVPSPVVPALGNTTPLESTGT